MIVRYLTLDEPVHSARARQIIEGPHEIRVTDGTIAETAFVLTRIYGIPREAVVDGLVSLLQRSNVIVNGLDTGLVVSALYMCRTSGRVSFADAMLWAVARAAGVDSIVYTFDRRFPSKGIETRS